MFASLRRHSPFGTTNRKRAHYWGRTARRCPHATRLLLEALEDRSLLSAGGLDPTFGGDGTVTTQSSAGGTSVAVQADGKVVVAGPDFLNGDFVVVRYNSDGTLDTSFNVGGTATVDFGGTDRGSSMAIDNSGRIILAGLSNSLGPLPGRSSLAVARLNPDGILDTTFSGDGKVTIDVDDKPNVVSVAVDGSGRIVIGGQSFQRITSSTDLTVVRLNDDGTLDTSFSDDGVATIDYGSNEKGGYVVVDANGRIVVAGSSDQGGTTGTDFALARLNDDGRLDTSFSGDGKATIDFGNSLEVAYAVTVDDSGRIFIAGDVFQEDVGSDMAVARLNEDGTLDNSFSGDGKTTIDFSGSPEDSGRSVVVDDNGRIVVAGYSEQEATSYDFAIARLNNDGSLDTSFSDDGKTTVDFGSVFLDDLAYAAAVDGSGRIVIAGETYSGFKGADFAVARLDGGTLTPQQLIDMLNDGIEQLVADGRLNHGQGNSLQVKLQKVMKKIEAGNWEAAVEKLEAFIDQVEDWDGTILTHEEAQWLIGLAEQILQQQP